MENRSSMARLKISARLIGLRLKWALFTLIQVVGFGLILLGALPIFAPFIKTVAPEILSGIYAWQFGGESILYIIVGGAIVWWTT